MALRAALKSSRLTEHAMSAGDAMEYWLTRPGQIEARRVRIEANPGEILVAVERTTLCQSDISYFQGTRPQETLARRLPLLPVHEAAGRVLWPRSRYGQRMALIPVRPCYLEDRTRRACVYCRRGGLGANRCAYAQFSGSDAPGFARTIVAVPSELVVPIPSGIDAEVAVLAEPGSVVWEAIESAELNPNAEIVVVNGGVLSVLLVGLLDYMGFDGNRMTVVDDRPERRHLFDGLCRVARCEDVPRKSFTCAFQCAGGSRISEAVHLAVDLLKPSGRLVLLGVSDNPITLDSRTFLSAAVALIPSFRSSRPAFERVLQALSRSPRLQALFRSQIIARVSIHGSEDVTRFFDTAATNRAEGRTVATWYIDELVDGHGDTA